MYSNDHLDGVFGYVRADELRRWDVLFAPVRQVVDDPSAADPKTVEVETAIGPQEYGSDTLLWTYRPNSTNTGCGECGAEPGVPCNPMTCCALEMLADLSERVREHHER
ncbi:hypothetical protein OG417_25200 [Actinoallomurus sp. NBC_01490]|jgi:hypothetical protein|uniref:hypothetical protein n=1 Tax=Actinoallomurus sp. NBC_01490 TaxID=2903557 RepID=UPI002E317F29|nr:hypothetical protein [Actinoallomurus sp. NBC_01490]